MSSGNRLGVMRPRGGFVVAGAGFEAAVQDADEPVGELAQRGVVVGAAGAELVVGGPAAGRGVQGGERMGHERVDEPVVVDMPGGDDLGLARRAGDRAGGGVVLAGLGAGVPGGVVTELCEHPGAEDRSKPWLGGKDLNVRVPAKM